MLAIVLSGGGAKGAYQLGVWKALRKLKIKYNIVTGSSIGAINGMMMAQNEFYKCMRLWKNINYEQLYDNFEYIDDAKKMYKNYFQKILSGGLDTKKIEKLINSNYNPNKLYNSKISFGVLSYNVTNRQAVNSTTKNTRPGILKKYILASATCFPAFKVTKIGSETYVDGGYYDNMPLNLAIDLGADEIIAVDLKAIGLKKRIKTKDVKVTYIKPKKKLEAFFMFEANAARKMINLGFNDTMKVFGKYDGDIYTFKKGTINNLIINYKDKMIDVAQKYDVVNIIKKINKDFTGIIDEALETLEVPLDKVYNHVTCNNELLKRIDKIEDINIGEFSLDEIKKVFDKKSIIKYFYTKIKKRDKINGILLNLFNKEFTTATYLIAIGS